MEQSRGGPCGRRPVCGNLPFFPCRRYFENIPKGLDREGWTRGGLQPQKPGGYALNQPVTRLEATPSPSESLRRLHPHVGRTLISEDPFYRTVPPNSHRSRFTAPN
uniref:Stabilizer of axonemal microtubules 4 n=1 Tax=Ovis aries TaxID=9940 RepID=A0AC11BR72_SHEEP